MKLLENILQNGFCKLLPLTVGNVGFCARPFRRTDAAFSERLNFNLRASERGKNDLRIRPREGRVFFRTKPFRALEGLPWGMGTPSVQSKFVQVEGP